MATKKQEIKTRLTADNARLKQALTDTEEWLERIGEKAKGARKEIKETLSAKGAKSAAANIGKSVGDSVAKSVASTFGLSGPASSILANGVKGAFSSGAALAMPLIGGLFFTAGKKFAKSVQDAVRIQTEADATTGGDTALYQQLQQGAKEAGTSVDKLTSAYEKFNEQLRLARDGNADAIDGFAKLGVSVSSLSGDSAEAFRHVVDGLSSTTDSTARAAGAMAIFGDNSRSTLDALEKASRVSLDSVVPQEAIDNASRLAEELGKMGSLFSGLWDSVKDFGSDLMGWTEGWLADIAAAINASMEMEDSPVKAAQRIEEARAKAAERRQAEAEARRARNEEARRKRNEEADRRTLEYQRRKEEEDSRRWRERKKVNREYELAGMSPHQRYAALREEQKQKYREMGYNEDAAEELTRRLYDPKAIAALQAEQSAARSSSPSPPAAPRETIGRPVRSAAAPSYGEQSAARSHSPDEYFSGRASRRFGEAGAAADRARGYRDEADALRAQAQEARDNGDKKGYRRLMRQAATAARKAGASRAYAKRVRSRAKSDERTAAQGPAPAVHGVAAPAVPSAPDYTGILQAIAVNLAALRANTYIVK